MSARAIGDIIAPILFEAVGIANLQLLLEGIDTLAGRKHFVMSWYEQGFITADQAELLIEHNHLEAA